MVRKFQNVLYIYLCCDIRILFSLQPQASFLQSRCQLETLKFYNKLWLENTLIWSLHQIFDSSNISKKGAIISLIAKSKHTFFSLFPILTPSIKISFPRTKLFQVELNEKPLSLFRRFQKNASRFSLIFQPKILTNFWCDFFPQGLNRKVCNCRGNFGLSFNHFGPVFCIFNCRKNIPKCASLTDIYQCLTCFVSFFIGLVPSIMVAIENCIPFAGVIF